MVKIAHAVANYDGIDGDGSGKEILVTNWYKRTGGWTYYLYCKSSAIADKAARYAQLIANNDNYGYSKETGSGGRWSGYNSIKSLKATGLTVEEAIAKGKGNFDCSSFCISCYILAGLSHKASGYTGNMVNTFVETGIFELKAGSEYTESSDCATVGCLYVTPKAHVAMSLENAGVKVDETTDSADIVTAIGSVRVRKSPKTGKTVDILRNGETATVLDVDSETGWYHVKTQDKEGYVTNNERYVKHKI